jgi:hypothetical protein
VAKALAKLAQMYLKQCQQEHDVHGRVGNCQEPSVLAVVAIVVKRRWRNVLNVVCVVGAPIARVLYNDACMFGTHTQSACSTPEKSCRQTQIVLFSRSP